MKKPFQQQGFTLIELLLYVAISSVLLLSIALLLSIFLESRIKNQTIAEVEQQGLQVMQSITQTVRNADTIVSPSIGTDGASLSMAVSDSAKSPTVFDLSNGVIRITEGAGSADALTNARVTASSLIFTNLSRSATPGIVRVQFTVATVNTTGRNEYNYAKTFYGSASLRQP